MSRRANYFRLAPQAMQQLLALEEHLHEQFRSSTTLSISLWELVKLRVSQLNQCAFCIDMHSKAAQRYGESTERIIGLSAWRDMPLYSPQEIAALQWAELISAAQPIDDRCYQDTCNLLGEPALVELTIAVNAINSWNRIAKTFKPEVGSHPAE